MYDMDKRRYPRVQACQCGRLYALHSERETLEVVAYKAAACCRFVTVNVGRSSILLHVKGLEQGSGHGFTPAETYRLMERMVRLEFDDLPLSLRGRVVRIDPETMHVAIEMLSVPGEPLWKSMGVQEQLHGGSPHSSEIRREH